MAAELILPITGSIPFVFTPDTLRVVITASDLNTGMSTVYFELKDAAPFDPNKYTSREWADRGTVTLPTSVVYGLKGENGLNVDLANAILANFNLQIDSTRYVTG